jgi:hypothetical protein
LLLKRREISYGHDADLSCHEGLVPSSH